MKLKMLFCSVLLVCLNASAGVEYFVGSSCLGTPAKFLKSSGSQEVLPIKYEKVLISLNKNSNSEITFFNAISLSEHTFPGALVAGNDNFKTLYGESNFGLINGVMKSPVTTSGNLSTGSYYLDISGQPSDSVNDYGYFFHGTVSTHYRLLRTISNSAGIRKIQFKFWDSGAPWMSSGNEITCESLSPIFAKQVPTLLKQFIQANNPWVVNHAWGIDYEVQPFYDEVQVQVSSSDGKNFNAIKPFEFSTVTNWEAIENVDMYTGGKSQLELRINNGLLPSWINSNSGKKAVISVRRKSKQNEVIFEYQIGCESHRYGDIFRECSLL